MPADEPVRVDASRLEAFAIDAFTAAGLAPDPAEILAEALTVASLRGVDTHGIVRVDPYSRKLDGGAYNPDPTITVDRRSPSLALVDADRGPGPVGATRAMEEALELATGSGIGLAVVRESNHLGMAGYYTLAAAERGCIGVAMSHGGPRVAPYGGVDPFFGTNPMAFSFPTGRAFPIVLDMSTSAGANAKIREAARRDEPIPEGWALDAVGVPTTDPEAVHALSPLGGAKGYGLGLVVELLTGLLAGTTFAPAVDTPFDDFSRSMRIAHLLVAVDVEAVRGLEAYVRDVDTLIDRLKGQRTAPGVEEIRLPGERSARTAEERRDHGVPLDDAAREVLATVAERYDLATPW